MTILFLNMSTLPARGLSIENVFYYGFQKDVYFLTCTLPAFQVVGFTYFTCLSLEVNPRRLSGCCLSAYNKKISQTTHV